jgi:phospholipid/cholesterol/gamma-HCH transport system substrate-binding protein
MKKGCFLTTIATTTILIGIIFYIGDKHGNKIVDFFKGRVVKLTLDSADEYFDKLTQTEYKDSLKILWSNAYKNAGQMEFDDGLNYISGILLKIDNFAKDSLISAEELFVILIWVIAWAKNVSVFSDQKELKISFDSVAGLETGDQVSINGVRKGYVNGIQISGNQVLVDVLLDEDVDIRSDATFSIMMLDLMGGKKLEIYPGTSDEKLDYSIVHQGYFSGDISTAMVALSGMEQDIRTIIEELTVTLNGMNELIGDKEFTANVKNSVSELNLLTKNVSKLITENREGIKVLVDSTAVLLSNSNALLTKNSENITTTVEQTKQFLENSNILVNRVDVFLQEIENKQNNVGKILYDEQFYTDLKTMMENIKELTVILNEQLKNEGINVDANLDLF